MVSAARVMNLSQSTSMVCISNKQYNGGNEVGDSSSKALIAKEHRQVVAVTIICLSDCSRKKAGDKMTNAWCYKIHDSDCYDTCKWS